MPRGQKRQTSHRERSRSIPRRVPLPRPRYEKELASLIEEQIAPWLTEELKRYIHPCGTSDPFLALCLPTFLMSCSYDNLFQRGKPDAYKAYQKFLTGGVAFAFCVVYMFVKIYEFPGPLPVQTLLKLPIFPTHLRIYRDTATVVIISYLLLLDINSSYIWLCLFPLIAVGFIYSLSHEHCSSVEQRSGSECIGVDVDPNNNGETTKEPEGLEFIVMVPFCALCALCTMAHLDSRAADRFVISQFLLFLSSTLGVLSRMMIRLPAGASPDEAPASELLQKSFLLLLLVTVHTIAAEALGEDVVQVCMPEVVPLLLWFSVHLDRESSIISIDQIIKPHKNVVIAFSSVATASLAYLAASMDESGISTCTSIMVSCGVSGLLTYYAVFMLDQWPGQQPNNMAADIGLEESEKHVSKGKGDTSSLEVEVQAEEKAGSSQGQEAMQLLVFWANALLIVAVALLLLKFLVARRLDLQEPLVDILLEKIGLSRFSSEQWLDKIFFLAIIAQNSGMIWYAVSTVLLSYCLKLVRRHERLRHEVNIWFKHRVSGTASVQKFTAVLLRLFS